MYKPKYFQPFEFVSRSVFNKRGEKSLQLLDDRILMTADFLRERYGPITINNWYWGGDRVDSGLRTSTSNIGSDLSQHRFGRALDMLFQNVSVEEVREDILKNPEKYPYVTATELGTSWLHIDCRNTTPILTFYP